jgi:hypothetical protein
MLLHIPKSGSDKKVLSMPKCLDTEMYALIALALLILVFALAIATRRSTSPPTVPETPTVPEAPKGPETWIFLDGKYLGIDDNEQLRLDVVPTSLIFTQEDGKENSTFVFSTNVNGTKKYLARGQQVVEGVNTLKLVDSKQDADRWLQDFVLFNEGKGDEKNKVLVSNKFVGDSSLSANLPYLVENTSEIYNNALSISFRFLEYSFLDEQGQRKYFNPTKDNNISSSPLGIRQVPIDPITKTFFLAFTKPRSNGDQISYIQVNKDFDDYTTVDRNRSESELPFIIFKEVNGVPVVFTGTQEIIAPTFTDGKSGIRPRISASFVKPGIEP